MYTVVMLGVRVFSVYGGDVRSEGVQCIQW